MRIYNNLFYQIISIENLVIAWDEFKIGKRAKPDVKQFEFTLEENLWNLHRELFAQKYIHKNYTSFYICDPKVRHIHKATVRDRIVHHAVFRVLYPIFEKSFIPDSFSCRISKGNHKGMKAVKNMIRKTSQNYKKPCFVLKCDIKKFFDSIDHQILLKIFRKKITDEKTRTLIQKIIGGFSANWKTLLERQGLPIGNLTSQLFANVYLNEFDHFIKETLKIKHYARYTDDFVIIHSDKTYLQNLIKPIQHFLVEKLNLQLHPKKTSIIKYRQGVDFLGYTLLPHYLIVRKNTKKRILRKLAEKTNQLHKGKIDEDSFFKSFQSYLGVLSHANTFNLAQNIKNNYGLNN